MKPHEFELKEEHIKLLKNTYIRWDDCEYGAPAIDPKRPFGNSGRYTIIREMAEILGIPTFKDMDGEDTITEEQSDYLENLWRETDKALQIIIQTITPTYGKYTAERYTKDWVYDSSNQTNNSLSEKVKGEDE